MGVHLGSPFLLMSLLLGRVLGDPSTRLVIPQGALTGVKMFTDSRVQLNAYLGIPYALPPIGDLRFAPPERHPGWNKTLVAEHFRPDCPQLQDQGSKPRQEQQLIDEDCLYLNVFVPEVAMTYRDFPVLLIIQGVDYLTGSPLSITAEDLSSEGIIVVTFSYRLNVFGFLSFGDELARGNLGILDQYLAMKWVKENIQYFGGLPANVTVMGHSSGASSVLIHMTSPRTKDLFQRAILMSGSLFSPWQQSWPVTATNPVFRTSRSIARSIGCLGANFNQRNEQNTRQTLSCMRQKSSDEILRAFQSAYKNGNWTEPLGPVSDSFLTSRNQYLPEDSVSALIKGQFHQMPLLTGITCNEGTVVLNRWKDLLNQSESTIRYFIENTAMPNILSRYRLNTTQVRYMVVWNYLDKMSKTSNLNHQLLQLYNDAMFTAPFWLQLQVLSVTNKSPVFVYLFTHPTYDHIGNYKQLLNLNESSHGSELVFLFGPTLFEKVSGRRFTTNEERLSLRMKRLWNYFIRTGDPTPPSYDYTLWDRFTLQQENYLKLYIDSDSGQNLQKLTQNPNREAILFWNTLLPTIENMTMEKVRQLEQALIFTGATNIGYKSGECSSYKNALFTTLGFLVLLLITLVLCLILLKKRTKERDRSIL